MLKASNHETAKRADQCWPTSHCAAVTSPWFRGPENTVRRMYSLVYCVILGWGWGGFAPQFNHHRKPGSHGVKSEWQFHLPPGVSEAEWSRVVQHTTRMQRNETFVRQMDTLAARGIYSHTHNLTKHMSSIWLDLVPFNLFKMKLGSKHNERYISIGNRDIENSQLSHSGASL
jgi:hypothetical protein